MRIALVAHSNAPWTPLYVRDFQALGHSVFVVSFHPDPVEGASYVFLGREPFELDSGKHLFVVRAGAVRRALSAFRPDVVHAPYLSSNGLAAALAWRGPLVVSALGGDVIEQPDRPFNWATRRLHARLVRFVCGRADVVHAVSQELADAVVGFGVPPSRVECFPIGVDLRRFHPRLRSETRTLRAVCTRRHEPVYENHVIVLALARLRSRGVTLPCTFAGSGRLEGALRRQVEQLDLARSVELTGWVPHEKLPSLLQSGDLYVSASARDGTSASLLEALACGLFPVLSRIPANEAWVRDGENGLLFDVGDDEGLARQLERGARDPALRAAASETNLRLVRERGDEHASMTRMVALFERAVRSRAGSSR